MSIRIRSCLLGLIASFTACGDSSTSPSVSGLVQAKASWTARHLSRYADRYRTTGFFIAYGGQQIRLVVLADTVRSAQFVASNEAVPVEPSSLPTIDRLFAMAIEARRNGTLLAFTLDPTLGYPTRLQLSGPPDARGVIEASNLELLP